VLLGEQTMNIPAWRTMRGAAATRPDTPRCYRNVDR
jgi:hypothetical protein